jgi:hypothetical protein
MISSMLLALARITDHLVLVSASSNIFFFKKLLIVSAVSLLMFWKSSFGGCPVTRVEVLGRDRDDVGDASRDISSSDNEGVEEDVGLP